MKTREYRLLAVVVLSLVACLRVSAAVAEEAKPAPVAETKAPASPKDAAAFVVRNGGMTQGVAIPADWDGRFGDCAVSRDTAVFKEGPASLCVTVAGGKSGQAFQRITGLAGQRIKIAGFIKSAGQVKAQAAVQAFAEGFKKNAWLQLKFVQGDTDWTAFEAEVAVPEWAAWINILLLAEGDGKAWLDEVRDAAADKVDPGKPVSAEQEMANSPPPKDKPWVPGWCIHGWRSAWFGMNKNFAERTKKGDIDLVFYGDSITMGWGDAKSGKVVWDKRYAPFKAVNYGIGGDSTRQLLWRIQHGEVEGISPKAVVLMIGTNNLYGDQNAGTDEEIAQGVAEVVKVLREKLPKSKVLLLAILPRQNDYFCGRIAKINAITAKLDDGKMVRYLDMGGKFLEAPGKVKADLYNPDQLHLGPKGYEVWADTMQPLLEEMMR